MTQPHYFLLITGQFLILRNNTLFSFIVIFLQFVISALPGLQIFDFVFDDRIESIYFIPCFVQQSLVPLTLLTVFSYFKLILLMFVFKLVNLSLPLVDFLLTLLQPPALHVVLLFITVLQHLNPFPSLVFDRVDLKVLFLD